MTKLPMLVLVTAALGISHANAADAGSSEGPYLGIIGGANFLQTSDVTVSIPSQPAISAELFYGTGWAGGALFGYGWVNGMAVEGEFTYRQNSIEGENVMGMPLPIGGHVTSYAAIINAHYDIDTATPFTPYLAAGAGAAFMHVNARPEGGGTFSDWDTVFAYQAMAGVSYALSTKLKLGAEYRFFATTPPQFDDNSVNARVDYWSHDVLIKLTFDLQ